MEKDKKPFTMNKKGPKVPPKKKEVLDLDELLVNNSNKTMILDLNEIEFDANSPEPSSEAEEVVEEVLDEPSVESYDDDYDVDDEKTEDISSYFDNDGSASSIIVEERPEMNINELLEEETIENFSGLHQNQDKTMVLSIEDIIETPPVKKNESFIEEDSIFNDTFNNLKSTTANTFIKNIDKKISSGLMPSDIPSKRASDLAEFNAVDTSNQELVEATSESLLDHLIYGRLDEFETELASLEDKVENNVVDLIKYMFEFYVKKDD